MKQEIGGGRRSLLTIAALFVLLLAGCGASDGSSGSGDQPDQGPNQSGNLRTPVQELQPGDCFNTEVGGGELTSVEITECSDPHRFEVVSVLAYDGNAKPSDAELVNWARAECVVVVEDILGANQIAQRLAFALPSQADWAELGDRNVICIHDAGPDGVSTDLAGMPTPDSSEDLIAGPSSDGDSDGEASVQETDEAPIETEPVNYNLSTYRICLHFDESLIDSRANEDCDSGFVTDVNPDLCPRGVLETLKWSYDSYDCEASIYLAFWEYAVSTLYGTPVRVDGVYTPEDYPKVKQFQSNMGLVADGHIGPLTWGSVKEFDCLSETDSEIQVCRGSQFAKWEPGAPLPPIDSFPPQLLQLLQ